MFSTLILEKLEYASTYLICIKCSFNTLSLDLFTYLTYIGNMKSTFILTRSIKFVFFS